MKITVKYGVSQSRTNATWDLEDLGLSVEEWNEMSKDKKEEILMEMMENDQPYWMVETFEEKAD